jgi:hypothetical protein
VKGGCEFFAQQSCAGQNPVSFYRMESCMPKKEKPFPVGAGAPFNQQNRTMPFCNRSIVREATDPVARQEARDAVRAARGLPPEVPKKG